MTSEDSMFVIDPEFAFYGPIGFDIGAIISNLIIAYIASFGHEIMNKELRKEQQKWLIEVCINSL